jgi:hypothetical protein
MKHFILCLLLCSSISLFAENVILEELQERPNTEEVVADFSVTYLNGKLTIENAPINSGVEIFSMLGVSIFREAITDSKQYFLLDLKKGYYIVKIAGVTKKISVK